MTNKDIYKIIGIAVAINIVLPRIVKHFASDKEIKPDNPKNLTFKEKIVHILVHHDQLPISSSLVVAIIFLLSIYIAKKI